MAEHDPEEDFLRDNPELNTFVAPAPTFPEQDVDDPNLSLTGRISAVSGESPDSDAFAEIVSPIADATTPESFIESSTPEAESPLQDTISFGDFPAGDPISQQGTVSYQTSFDDDPFFNFGALNPSTIVDGALDGFDTSGDDVSTSGEPRTAEQIAKEAADKEKRIQDALELLKQAGFKLEEDNAAIVAQHQQNIQDLANLGSVDPNVTINLQNFFQDLANATNSGDPLPSLPMAALLGLPPITQQEFDEDGNVIRTTQVPNPLIKQTLDAYQAVVSQRENLKVQRENIALEKLRLNPFNRTQMQDTALQALLARGGLSTNTIKLLEGIRARGGLSAAQVNTLEQLKARDGLTETQFAEKQALERQAQQFALDNALTKEEEQQRFIDELFGGRTQEQFNLFEAARTAGILSAEDQESLARGGLSVQERLTEISASQEGSRLETLAQLLSDPAALGTLIASGGGQGLLGDLGGQGLNIQAGGEGIGKLIGQGNLTLSDLLGTSREQQQALAGASALQGITPSALLQLIQGFTPGTSQNAGVFSGGVV